MQNIEQQDFNELLSDLDTLWQEEIAQKSPTNFQKLAGVSEALTVVEDWISLKGGWIVHTTEIEELAG
tara:strand:- start:712 stop:915 length:204 start_codon:yes stop_codon:yes gene_type:complete